MAMARLEGEDLKVLVRVRLSEDGWGALSFPLSPPFELSHLEGGKLSEG